MIWTVLNSVCFKIRKRRTSNILITILLEHKPDLFFDSCPISVCLIVLYAILFITCPSFITPL